MIFDIIEQMFDSAPETGRGAVLAGADRRAAREYGVLGVWGIMGKYGRDYEAFEIFEQIQSEEGQKETAPQPLSQRRITEVLSFEEAPYFEIEYDAGPVQNGEMIQVPGAVPVSGVPAEAKKGTGEEKEAWNPIGTEKRKETGAEAGGAAGVEEKKADATWTSAEAAERKETETEPDTWRWPVGQQPVPEQIERREEDPVRELFNRMRDIAREDRYFSFRSSNFYDQRMQRENAKIFYRQGMFMKDFEDAYAKTVPYSSYFPSYQMMGYDQLRTFFTWRTQIRRANVEHISLSYAYLYIYELLNNIGVDSPEEGLGQLLFFWEAFRVYDKSVDKYVPKWLKDYHIYYELPQSFPDFVEENGLEAYYPGMKDEEEGFDSYCAISKYDIRKSAFYGEGREDMVKRCFSFTLERLREALAEGSLAFEACLYQPARNMSVWVPFKGALFYPSVRQRDRKVVLSRKEVYVCSHNEWTCSAMITADSGKRLLGYVMKQMEAVLRKVTKFKYKLSANPDMLSPVMADELKKAGICLETVITDAVKAFYKEETKTVVRVNPGALEKIRQEAYAIQEKLTVPEEGSLTSGQMAREEGFLRSEQTRSGEGILPLGQTGAEKGSLFSGATGAEAVYGAYGENHAHKSLVEAGDVPDAKDTLENREEFTEGKNVPKKTLIAAQEDIPDTMHAELPDEMRTELPYSSQDTRIQAAEYTEKDTVNDEWKALGETLTETERQALRIILNDKTNLKQFADEQGIMLEVLAEGINEKASDMVGDGLLDNDFEVYEDYLEDVSKMLDKQ